MADTLQSVHQALRVLTLLQGVDELGLTEISDRLGIGKSSAHRLLATMRDARFVDRTPTRRYRLGPAMSGSPEAAALEHCAEMAKPHLKKLRDLTRETVHISSLSGTSAEFLAVCESTLMMRVASKIGESLPAHATSAGKLMLSTLSEPELFALYPDERLPAVTAKAIATRTELLAELARVRELGYGRNVSESEEGVAALAVPLHRPTGRTVCTLTITGPTLRFNPEGTTDLSDTEARLLTVLRACAHAIERDLRY